MKEAFVYSWRNKTTNCLYIGFHKGSENDGYVCSSKKLLEEYTINPDNFERYIIAHGTVKDMVTLEMAILKSVNAKNNPDFYNQHNGNGLYFCKHHTEESKKKIGLAQLGTKKSEETKAKLKEKAKTRNPECYIKSGLSQRGKKKSPKHLENLRKAFAKPISEETREKMRLAKLGKKRGPHSEETKAKMRLAKLGKKLIKS